MKMRKLSVILAISSLFFGSSQGMERPPRLGHAQSHTKEWVEVDALPIIAHVGSHVSFYGEYKATKLSDTVASFPLKACDPLPINEFGTIGYFFTSAIAGKVFSLGQPVKIEDPTISDIVVIRGKDQLNQTRFEAYLGLNKKEYQTKNNSKIYVAKLLALNTKSTRFINEIRCPFFNGCKLLTAQELGQEARKYLKDPNDADWRNERFLKLCLDLLGGDQWRQYVDYSDVVQKTAYTMNGITFKNGYFYSENVYWTESENTLKGIIYQKR